MSSPEPDVVPLPMEELSISITFIRPSGFSCFPLTEILYLADVSELLLFSEWWETLPLNDADQQKLILSDQLERFRLAGIEEEKIKWAKELFDEKDNVNDRKYHKVKHQ